MKCVFRQLVHAVPRTHEKPTIGFSAATSSPSRGGVGKRLIDAGAARNDGSEPIRVAAIRRRGNLGAWFHVQPSLACLWVAPSTWRDVITVWQLWQAGSRCLEWATYIGPIACRAQHTVDPLC